MKSKILFTLILLWVTAGRSFADSGINFSPAEWNFGTIKAGNKISHDLTIENKNNEAVALNIISTCDCLEPENRTLSLKSGEKATITLKYNSESDSGTIKKFFIIRTSLKDLSKALYPVYGEVKSSKIEKAPASSTISDASIATNGTNAINLLYYYTPGCKKCEVFLRKTIPSLEKELGKTIIMHKKDVLDTKVFEEYQNKLNELGIKGRAFPVIIWNKKIIQGNEEIQKNIKPFLTDTNAINPAAPKDTLDTAQKQELLMLPVIAAGLLDGINPCAFTTLIFLLSYLAIAGRSRREILVIGIFFTASIFITYYMIGLGFFHALRAAQSVPIVALIIKWTLVAVLAVFAALSFYDFILVKQGRPTEIVLQLPTAIKNQLHKSIRTYARSAALIGSSVILGFLVSIFELACTGQVYFPTITYYIQVQKQVSLYFFLGIYNLCFILPLVIVFILTYAGISSKNLTEAFQKQLGPVKIGTAILFIVLAILVILF